MIKSIAICSRSFSSNKLLVKNLNNKFEKVKLNSDGLSLSKKSLINFLNGYESTIIGLEEISEEVVKNLPDLKIISKYGVGIDKIDIEALKKYDIKFRYTPGVNKRSVAELVLSFTLSLLRNTFNLHQEVVNGKWKQNLGNELTGLKFGILGFGHVGQDLYKLLNPFNCQILFHDKYNVVSENKLLKAKKVDLQRLFSDSDIISIHVPLNDETRNMISHKLLKLMKPNAILINTARGGIVNEEDLFQCLKHKRISSAAFDVLSTEPPVNNKLLHLNNFFVTPHIGSSTIQAINAMGLAAIDGILKD